MYHITPAPSVMPLERDMYDVRLLSDKGAVLPNTSCCERYAALLQALTVCHADDSCITSIWN